MDPLKLSLIKFLVNLCIEKMEDLFPSPSNA